MPNSIIKSFSKRTGKSVDDVERLWDKAQTIAKDNGLSDERMYSYTVGILKKMLNIDEDFGIGVGEPAALDSGMPSSGDFGSYAPKIGKTQKRKYTFRDYLKNKVNEP